MKYVRQLLLGILLALSLSSCGPTLQLDRRAKDASPPTQTAQTQTAALTTRFETALEAGQFDEAQKVLRELERTFAGRLDCMTYNLRRAGRSDKLARGYGRQDPAVCEGEAEQLADMKLKLGASRLQSQATPEGIRAAGRHLRSPLFVEPGLLATVDASLMPVISGLAQRTNTEAQGRELAAALALAAKDPDAAVQRLEAHVDAARLRLGDSDPYLALQLNALSALEDRRGHLDRALQHARSAHGILVKAFGDDAPAQCVALWQEAALLLGASQLPQAAEAVDRCLRVPALKTEPLMHASALNNLGVIQHRVGNTPEAIESYQASLRLVAGRYDFMNVTNARTITPQIHSNLGLAYWQGGNPSRAYDEFRLAQEVQQSLVSEVQHDDEQGVMARVSKLSAEQDVYITLERETKDATAPGRSIGLQMLLERKGLALERRIGQTTAARQLAASSFGSAPDEVTRSSLANEVRGALERRQALLARRAALAQGRPSSPDEAASLKREAEQLDAEIRVLDAQLAGTPTTVESSKDQSQAQRAMVAELMRATRRLSNPVKEQKKAKQDRREQGRSDPLGAPQDGLGAITQGPAFQAYFSAWQRREQEARLGVLERIQSRLGPSSALLEMVQYRPFTPGASDDAQRWGEPRYGTYVVRRDSPPDFVDLGEASQIDQEIVEFRRALSVPRGTLAHDLGRRLDERLRRPLHSFLGGATEVLVSPEGLLNLVPFAALVGEDGRYLVERFTFNYLTSGRDLLRDAVPPSLQRSAPVIVAAPAFGESVASAAAMTRSVPSSVGIVGSRSRSFGDMRFDPLPGTAEEARALNQVVKGAVVLAGDRATETALKGVRRPRLLHIATHGFFLGDESVQERATPLAENPMLRSGLALAGANRLQSGADDGVLTALEAAGLDLLGTQMVVLSACETGVGEIRNGEGVFGLRRAFMAAGAETLVMSLWQVDDEATRQLMTEFYRRVDRGEGRAEALRSSATAMMRDPAHSHPFYWAGFISSGQSSPIR